MSLTVSSYMWLMVIMEPRKILKKKKRKKTQTLKLYVLKVKGMEGL